MHFRLTAVLSLLVSGAALGGPAGKISKHLEKANPDDEVGVIVQYKRIPNEGHEQRVRYNNGRLHVRLPFIKANAYRLKAKNLRDLEQDPDVESITPDYEIGATLDYADESVHADIVQSNGWSGAGIAIAVVDSGVATHADLKDPATGASRVAYSENFLGDGAATDTNGHGTHVAGIIAGNGASSTGAEYSVTFKGVAPAARIVSLRVLDEDGKGRDSAVVAAIGRAIELKSRYNIRVLNLSVGRPVYGSYLNDPLARAVENAWRAGIVVVVSAGNSGRDNSIGNMGYGTITAPGNHPWVITVGAVKTNETPTTADDSVASYSSKGPALFDWVVKPDLVAPGNNLVSLQAPGSTLATQYPGNKLPNSVYTNSGTGLSTAYFKLSGTSMATPMVSGAVALLLQKEPGLTPDQVKARLMKTAAKTLPTTSVVTTAYGTFTLYYDVFTVGAGYLDVLAALTNADIAWGNAHSPRLYYNSATRTIGAAFDAGAVWSLDRGVVWGTDEVWGDEVNVSDRGVVWGTGIVFANSVPQGLGVVWGSTTPVPPAAGFIAVSGER